ncbi:antibiotic biosynthesis monooxygenase [Nonomuraea sp. MG754425]|uniref:antibiotic biosynthesis monooxygenase n=1 Tax=Nonomuraea sp. MG754425 TaxID=2570319 RepID=UPI001F442FBF|nr:antibiotic biosynthesis monooxygenase [Nonomuraea sp. MG754425]MCF6470995.1 antibiotic biosynthesis monooxygenase [Nonomuraea sp. MG754425]
MVISSKVREGRADDYRRWQQKLNESMRSFAGFEEAEAYPPVPGEQPSWVSVFRFSDIARLTGWLNSESRTALLEEVQPLLDEPPALEVLAGRTAGAEAVTAVISHSVRPGREDDYAHWQDRLHRAEERFPGFLGFESFAPVPGVQPHWVVMTRFDTREHLDNWLASDTRRKLLDEGRDCVVDFDVRTVKSAFGGWFRFGGGATEEGAPPNWKQAMCVLLALYPTVMALNLTVSRALSGAGLPGYLVLFVGNVLSVALLTWVLMPLVNRVFAAWLRTDVPRSSRASAAGALVIVLCYALSIAAFAVITR